MKKFILPLLLLLCSCSLISSPNPVPDKLSSVVKFYTQSNECTAFSVVPGIYMTANHCFQDSSTTLVIVNGGLREPAELGMVDKDNDFASFNSYYMRPGLNLGAEPRAGDTLYQIGYGMDSAFPLYWSTGTMGVQLDTNYGWKLVLDHFVIQGMSGGPILDVSGKVVGMNQMSTTTSIAYSSPYKDFRKFYRKLGGS